MSLSNLLQSAMRSNVSDDQGPWRQFILDHLDYIANRTVATEINAIEMNQFRYDLDRYLKTEKTRHEDIAWIVLLLNDLPNDLAFDKPGTYVIPTDRLITDLYLSYTTITHNT